ncbi:haloacid dehalogenase [Pseudalgibacter alginicilyticus]|uniref:Haloacid dehalogenase n=1 Tax=Pseudalgibacter alginicilyticus TaxID=1736674 RepID=A0A0P0CJ17_9FLAO|nr:Cof-type HAD-IIB family hydrolase [Pseudalgibacter alginicilyticus]ALJ04354.1 haloacid dehalogenase [Pseudalgibacter alginicilyticus]
MQYKLICSDIDGTLLNKDRELSQVTIAEIQRISPIPFILISSRMPSAMRHLQVEIGNLNTPLIAYNGGYIVNNDTVLESTFISNKILETIILKCKNTSIHLSLYHADEWYVPALDYWAKREYNNTKVMPVVKSNNAVLKTWIKEKKGAHKIMCMGDEKEIDTLYKNLEMECRDDIMLYRSKSTYIEISQKSISKKTAIESLIKNCYSEISMENIIAFGDNYNDVEMLKSVGMGVAVANANDAVMKIANKITDTNKNDGVAKAIKDLIK